MATDVDHDDGNPSNNSPDNLVPRCHSCHSAKTMREQHGTTYGCDVNGWPTDPRSHWNKTEKSLGSEPIRPPPGPRFQRNGRG